MRKCCSSLESSLRDGKLQFDRFDRDTDMQYCRAPVGLMELLMRESMRLRPNPRALLAELRNALPDSSIAV